MDIQVKVREKNRNRKFSKEEFEKLKELVEKYGEQQIDEINEWTPDEDKLILDKVKDIGEEYSIIANLIKGRSAIEVKCRHLCLKNGNEASQTPELQRYSHDFGNNEMENLIPVQNNNENKADLEVVCQIPQVVFSSEHLPKFEHYEAIKLIGNTKMSKVYIVRDLNSGKHRCAKFIKSEFAHNEINIHRQLNHKYIVQFIESYSGITDNAGNEYYIIITECCEQSDLRKFLLSNKLTLEKKKEIIKEAAEAINYMHSTNISHGDIKEMNFLVSDDNTVKLCDFGFSILNTDPPTLVDYRRGTPGYIAPEIGRNEPYDPFKADVYAFGKFVEKVLSYPTFYIMGSGSNINHLQEEVRKIRQLESWCTSHEPSDRCSMKQFLDALS